MHNFLFRCLTSIGLKRPVQYTVQTATRRVNQTDNQEMNCYTYSARTRVLGVGALRKRRSE